MRRCILLIALLPLAGCGRPVPVPVHPVSGRVKYAGRPVAGVQVFLLPTSAPMVPQVPSNPRGVTDAEGRFTLATYRPGDGAAEGGYQVVLLWPRQAEGEESTGDQFLGWYDPVHTKLTARIRPGQNDLPPINVPVITRPPEAVEGVPGRN